jgi:glutamate/tyrosine decarboxylase-like PLP-dependent enzyme
MKGLEERYVVVKMSDIHPLDLRDLRDYLDHQRIPTRECVVVESDWPIYDCVVQMVLNLEEEQI